MPTGFRVWVHRNGSMWPAPCYMTPPSCVEIHSVGPVSAFIVLFNRLLQRHLWTYWGNVLGFKTTKVTPLHLLHTSTTFGANVSYRLQMTRTDRPTNRQSLLYAIPWVWQWLSTSSLMWMLSLKLKKCKYIFFLFHTTFNMGVNGKLCPYRLYFF